MRKPLLLTLVLLVAVPMFAADIAVPRNIVVANVDGLSQVNAAASPARRPGAVIAKDADTGELRAPTTAELQDLSRQISVMQKQRRTLAPKVQAASDGTLSATLDESLENLTVAFRTDRGTIEHVCAAGTDGVLQLLRKKAQAPKAEKEIK
jgi:hypothetical protein